jgi:two-component system, chemotaxis family, protein-glutamate methylesterase/glutaminase
VTDAPKIKVLVVDDSAVVRGLLSRAINSQPDMTVIAVASDPIAAIERLKASTPDVLTLDVEMPRMDGLQFLEKLMRIRPLPVVMVSSLTARGAEVTMRALELGAVDFVAKPGAGDAASLAAYTEEVADKVRAAAAARVSRRTSRTPIGDRTLPPRGAALSTARTVAAPAPARSPGPASDKTIVIGSSTGGVEALREVLVPLPQEMPPILIAQHMPGGFTRTFAQRLDASCSIHVKEADDGEILAQGNAYIAPGDWHMLVERKQGRLAIRLSDGPPVNRHRPSVDPLFRSAAQTAGAKCIGVMLSGMGADGAQAMLELRQLGAHNIAQDEASCVVFGMPKQAIAAGAVHDVLPLRDISARLVELSRG